MPAKESVSRIRVELGSLLRGLRTMAGDSQRDLERRISMAQVAISRTETGERLPTRAKVVEWLDVYSADDDIRRRVLAVTEAAHTETRTWSDLMPAGESHLQGVAWNRENTARLVRTFHNEWVPGLLQTAEYARQLVPQVDPAGLLDVAATVADRLERQRALYDRGRHFEFLLTEPVLWWSPGEAVMAAQLDRIASVATLSGVQVGILPARRTGVAVWHPFTITEPDDGDPTFVSMELLHGGPKLEDPARVTEYTALWERLWAAAVTGDDAVALIREVGA